jgi:uncharacterized protein (TIGR02147 family)
MEQTQSYHIHKIQDGLSLKQRQNPNYSLRAYARDLGVHAATLSQVLKGTRPLPIKDSLQVVQKLQLPPKERTLFLESLYRSKTKLDDIKIDQNDERFMLDESHYKAIAEWEHYAVLTLFDLEEFKCSLDEISKRLNITLNRSQVVIENLLQCGLLTLENGIYVKNIAPLRTTEDINNLALRNSHIETLEMGKTKLDEIEVMLRDFSAMTIAMDPLKLTEAKTIIREFRQKMAALLRNGKKSEVYHLAIQFYPLTTLKKETI